MLRDLRGLDQAVDGYKIFERIHGHCRVPMNFTVPESDPWPKRLWGMKLGQRRSTVRHTAYKFPGATEYKEELRRIGFDFEPRRDNRGFESLFLALKSYKEISGSLKMRSGFIVPSEPPWPEQVWGLRLASRVENIISGVNKLNALQKQRLLDIGFNFYRKRKDPRRFPHVYRALLEFKEKYGHLDVPYSFRIPSRSMDNSWPKDLYGLCLGQRVNNIRHRGTYRDYRPALNAIGFLWKKKLKRKRIRVKVDAGSEVNNSTTPVIVG